MHSGEKFTIIIPPQDISCEPGLQEKIANGDRDAFAWVYKNYCKKVFDYAMMMTGSEEQSEDIVQDVFLKLWNKREQLAAVKNFNGYLYMVYKHTVLQVLRGQRLRITSALKEWMVITDDGMNPFEQIKLKEMEKIVHQSVQQLPPQRKLIYKLRDNGWKKEQIAKALHISPNTVKNSLQKALRSIRNEINYS